MNAPCAHETRTGLIQMVGDGRIRLRAMCIACGAVVAETEVAVWPPERPRGAPTSPEPASTRARRRA